MKNQEPRINRVIRCSTSTGYKPEKARFTLPAIAHIHEERLAYNVDGKNPIKKLIKNSSRSQYSMSHKMRVLERDNTVRIPPRY